MSELSDLMDANPHIVKAKPKAKGSLNAKRYPKWKHELHGKMHKVKPITLARLLLK